MKFYLYKNMLSILENMVELRGEKARIGFLAKEYTHEYTF